MCSFAAARADSSASRFWYASAPPTVQIRNRAPIKIDFDFMLSPDGKNRRAGEARRELKCNDNGSAPGQPRPFELRFVAQLFQRHARVRLPDHLRPHERRLAPRIEPFRS